MTEINMKQRRYITDYICNFEDVLFSAQFTDPEEGYRAWIDEKSLIDWYIACELVGNSDSFWSTYIYKKREDKASLFRSVMGIMTLLSIMTTAWRCH